MSDTPAPLVFLDVETTGLGPDDEIWEIAAVRRDWDGNVLTTTEMHAFVEHGPRCAHLPEAFRDDHAQRFPSACSGRVISRRDACRELGQLFDISDRSSGDLPIVVGVNPGFDLEKITALIAGQFPNWPTLWHYTPVDARHLAVGRLKAAGWDAPAPWGSEDVSRALGINPDDFARHTAMGDVLWAMAIYDAATNTTPLDVQKKETTAP